MDDGRDLFFVTRGACHVRVHGREARHFFGLVVVGDSKSHSQISYAISGWNPSCQLIKIGFYYRFTKWMDSP